MGLLKAAGLLAIVGGLVAGSSATDKKLEYDVKAAFLSNFGAFIEWPESEPETPFPIGIVGRDPFGATIDEIARGKQVHGRPLVVKRYATVREASECLILYIGESRPEALIQLLRDVRPGVLTVGEADRFLQSGGMIRFVLIENKVRFEISQSAARRAGLRVSSQLLKLGRSVE